MQVESFAFGERHDLPLDNLNNGNCVLVVEQEVARRMFEPSFDPLPSSDYSLRHLFPAKGTALKAFHVEDRVRFTFTRIANTGHALFMCGTFTLRRCIPMRAKREQVFELTVYISPNINYEVYFFCYTIREYHSSIKIECVPAVAQLALVEPEKGIVFDCIMQRNIYNYK